jgi:hypothetical protein
VLLSPNRLIGVRTAFRGVDVVFVYELHDKKAVVNQALPRLGVGTRRKYACSIHKGNSFNLCITQIQGEFHTECDQRSVMGLVHRFVRHAMFTV